MDVLTVLFFTIVVPAAAYFCLMMILNDRGTMAISNNYTFWAARMKAKGFVLSQVPGSRDDAPCEVQWKLMSDDVRIIRGGWSMYRLIKKIDAGKVLHCRLQAASKWPSSKLPV